DRFAGHRNSLCGSFSFLRRFFNSLWQVESGVELPDKITKAHYHQYGSSSNISQSPRKPVADAIAYITPKTKTALRKNKCQRHRQYQQTNCDVFQVAPNRKNLFAEQQVHTRYKKECADKQRSNPKTP